MSATEQLALDLAPAPSPVPPPIIDDRTPAPRTPAPAPAPVTSRPRRLPRRPPVGHLTARRAGESQIHALCDPALTTDELAPAPTNTAVCRRCVEILLEAFQ